jgi:hypothetical protein
MTTKQIADRLTAEPREWRRHRRRRRVPVPGMTTERIADRLTAEPRERRAEAESGECLFPV